MNRPAAFALGALALAACSLLNAPDDIKPGGTGGSVGAGGNGGAGGGAGGSTGGHPGKGGGGHKATCGDGHLDPGETCDPVKTCPTSCPARTQCTDHKLTGDAKHCTAKCEDVPYTVCSGATKDGCCPKGSCDGTTDLDCALCGNGVVDLGETCDSGKGAGGGGGAGGGAGGPGSDGGPGADGGPGGSGAGGGSELGKHFPCPSCDDGDACTVDHTAGGAATCDVTCTHAPISQCVGGDGCCPAGCTLQNDSDCCGTDCFGPTGCVTAAGRCIRFACRDAASLNNFCATCMGPQWREITRDDWLGGYCADVTARFRSNVGYQSMCGGNNAACCGALATCTGNDSAWHFFDPADNTIHYMGPVLTGSAADPATTNCTFWDAPQAPGYSRLGVCQL